MEELTYQDMLALYGIGGAHPGGLALTRNVLGSVQLTEKSCVLDVGCGTGQTSAFVAALFRCKVTALDRHRLMIEKAGRRFRDAGLDVRLVQGDAERMPFPAGSFDLLLAESVTIFTDLSRSLSEYVRVLRPGGVLLSVEMTAERPFSAAELQDLRRVYNTRLVPTEAEWRGRLERAGFTKVDVLLGGTVQSALPGPHSEGDALPEHDPSQVIDPAAMEILAAHQELTQRYARRLGYRVYRASL